MIENIISQKTKGNLKKDFLKAVMRLTRSSLNGTHNRTMK
jgi:hypothetical protein